MLPNEARIIGFMAQPEKLIKKVIELEDKVDAKKIQEIQGMIKRHQEAVKPAGHNTGDEDIAKVASAEPIGKSDSSETLRK